MAGRNTTLDGPRIDAGWVVDATQRRRIHDLRRTVSARKELERLIGRRLTRIEIRRIQRACDHAKAQQKSGENVLSQDIKRTLRHLTKTPADFLKADGLTQAAIEGEFPAMGVDFEAPPLHAIAEAAGRALIDLTRRRYGRPAQGWQRSLSRFAVETWLDMGGGDMRIWRASCGQDKQYASSPLLMWTATILEIARGCKVPHSQVERLLKGG